MPFDIIPPSAVAACAGVVLLRSAWGHRQRMAGLTALAWGMLMGGALLGMWANGAWGLAVVVQSAMATAMVVLAVAAIGAPAGKPVRTVQRRVTDAPQSRHIGRRLMTLLLTGPAPMIVALLIALALRAMAAMAGWSQANSNVLCLLTMPILWAGLTFWLLMTGRRSRQLLILATASVPSAAILWIGSIA